MHFSKCPEVLKSVYITDEESLNPFYDFYIAAIFLPGKTFRSTSIWVKRVSGRFLALEIFTIQKKKEATRYYPL